MRCLQTLCQLQDSSCLIIKTWLLRCAALCVVLCAAAKVDAAALAARVDDVWTARLTQPDPLVQGCQRDEVRGVANRTGDS